MRLILASADFAFSIAGRMAAAQDSLSCAREQMDLRAPSAALRALLSLVVRTISAKAPRCSGPPTMPSALDASPAAGSLLVTILRNRGTADLALRAARV